jgi:hypothetical protein
MQTLGMALKLDLWVTWNERFVVSMALTFTIESL